MEASAFRAPDALAPARRPAGVLLRLRTDEQLVALFRQGNEDAFRIIHDRYRQRLSAYARQMLAGSATDADDAMQDVFLRAYGALRADDRPVTLRAWLYRVAHNRCIDHLRRPASQPTDELLEGSHAMAATTGDPIVAAEGREALRRLVVDLRALPEQQRSALLMREMEGLSYVELAAALQVTVPAVKSLLVRARMGLVESRQARDTPCHEIREDITSAHDRGVRASGRSRRHTRECPGCAGFRTTLKGMSGDLAALDPASAGPWWGSLLKLIGLGAGGSGAAGGAAAAGGGATVVGTGAVGASGTIAIGTGAATKIAAVVWCAAVLGGGVEAARERVAPATSGVHRGAPATVRSAAAAGGAGTGGAGRALGPAERLGGVERASVRRAAGAPGPARPARRVATASPLVITAPEPFVPATDTPADSTDTASADGGVEAPDDADGVPAGDPVAVTDVGAGTGTTGPGTSVTGTGTTGGTGSGPPTSGSATTASATSGSAGTGAGATTGGGTSGTTAGGSTGGGDAGPRSGDTPAGAGTNPTP